MVSLLDANQSLNDALPEPSAGFSLLSYNILLPNSHEAGWWVFKYYDPTIDEAHRTWSHRQALLRQALLGAQADVICLQETTEEGLDEHFGFLSGYAHVQHRKGALRCATYWRSDRLALAADPQHRDRTLLTALRSVQHPERSVIVVNAHLKAGDEAARRVRQVDEALEQASKMVRASKGDLARARVVVCGDLNSNPEGSGVERFLQTGEITPEAREARHPEQELTGRVRRHPFGRMEDAYTAAYAGAPPATMLLSDQSSLFLDERGELSAPFRAALGRIFQQFSGGRATMDRAAVEAWITTINRAPGRGSEWDKALEVFTRRGVDELTEDDLVAIYESELREGKPWSVRHDLHACGVAMPQRLRRIEGRFDQIHYTSRTLSLKAVRRSITDAQKQQLDEQHGALPNAWHPSDHLPVAAVFGWEP